MSEATVTPAAATISVDPAKPAPPAAAAPTAPTQPTGEPNDKPSWLDARLERERRAILKDLGIESLEDGKKAISEANAKREADKTAAQKAAELEGSLKQTRAEKDAMAEALGAYAKAQLKGLTDAQREAVLAIAGDDATKQLKAVEALSPTWKTAIAAATTTTTTKTEKPADTAPAAGAPSGTTPNLSPPDPKAIYAELKKTNPVIAARYAIANNVHDT